MFSTCTFFIKKVFIIVNEKKSSVYRDKFNTLPRTLSAPNGLSTTETLFLYLKRNFLIVLTVEPKHYRSRGHLCRVASNQHGHSNREKEKKRELRLLGTLFGKKVAALFDKNGSGALVKG